jgi:hypothetical protein
VSTNTFSLEVDSEVHDSVLASHFDFEAEVVEYLPKRVGVGWQRLNIDIACPLDIAQLLYSRSKGLRRWKLGASVNFLTDLTDVTRVQPLV